MSGTFAPIKLVINATTLRITISTSAFLLVFVAYYWEELIDATWVFILNSKEKIQVLKINKNAIILVAYNKNFKLIVC